MPHVSEFLVFCGHDNGAVRLTSTRPDGSRVHQMLADYQWLNGPDNGYGFLRALQFDYEKKEIRVETYSPTLDQFLTDDANQFTVSLATGTGCPGSPRPPRHRRRGGCS